MKLRMHATFYYQKPYKNKKNKKIKIKIIKNKNDKIKG